MYKGSNATLKSHRPIVYALHSIHQQHSTRVLLSVRSLNKRLASCFESVQCKQPRAMYNVQNTFLAFRM